MKVFGIAGYSGMGKTTLLERLVPELNRRGLRVSLVKHSDKDIEVDRPGKDSYRLREAGCHEVLVLGSRRWALMHELAPAQEPSLEELLARLHGCDLVLVEGFKHGCFPKLEVWRATEGRPPLWPGLDILAVATPPPHRRALRVLRPGCRMLPLSEIGGIADFVLRHAQPLHGLGRPGVTSPGASPLSCASSRHS